MNFTLVEIYDADDDHEVGGQDLPNLVTVKVEDGSVEEALESDYFNQLHPFNIKPGVRHKLPGYLEFRTFSFEAAIRKHFEQLRDWSR